MFIDGNVQGKKNYKLKMIHFKDFSVRILWTRTMTSLFPIRIGKGLGQIYGRWPPLNENNFGYKSSILISIIYR